MDAALVGSQSADVPLLPPEPPAPLPGPLLAPPPVHSRFSSQSPELKSDPQLDAPASKSV